MKRLLAAIAVCGACLACPVVGNAADASTSDDRLTLMAAGSTLTGTDGGWGASVGWLHNFNANTIFGLGAERQTIGDADWTFGSVNFSHGMGQAAHRTTLYVEGHEGSGKDAVHSYGYSIYAAGVYQGLTRQLSLQLEDKYIDVDTVRGNLPKLGVQYLWSTRLSSTVSYAHSVSGNLDTRLTGLRVDGYTKTMNVFAGLANGRASPVVINVQGIELPGQVLHEYFVGVGRSFSRADMTAVFDYSKLADSEHLTLTFSCIVHRRTGGAGR